MFKLDRATAAGGVAVLAIHGPFGFGTSSALPSAVDDAIRGAAIGIVVDFSETTFVDSSGLGALVASLNSAHHAGLDLRIAGPSKHLRRLLDRAALSGVVQEVPVPIRIRP